tara:strand:- start:39 stop:2885 length:2847 start_codon:yes stop_codon:yes gene_type:complete
MHLVFDRLGEMKKFLAFYIFIFLQFVFLNASEINLDQKIPLDKEIKYGKLDNGLTYYIKKNKTPKKRAKIYLIVKAGSLMEDDDQLGLAHLIEHMVFNGTKNFPKNAIEEYFNSIGLSIGADFNAHTGFEKTVYKIDIPTDKKENIEKGIHILSEISNFALLDNESFEKERKIIEEEWRGDKGKSKRLYEEIKKYYYLNSRYEKRTPIGDINIIRNFTYDTARRFYDDWYRPDLMGVIAVGDFDEKYIEDLIKEYFNKAKNKNSKRPLPDTKIPDYQKTIFVPQTDPEQTSTLFQILNKNLKFKTNTLRNVRKLKIHSFCENILQKRFYSITSDKESAALLFGYAGKMNLGSNNEFYQVFGKLNENKIEEGIKILFEEIERIKQNGFRSDELEIEKEEMIDFYEQAVKAKKTRSSASFVSEYSRNFLENEFVVGEEREYEIAKQLHPSISVSDLNKHFLNWYRPNNRIIRILYPEKISNIISKEELVNLESKVQKTKFSQFKSLAKDEPLLAEELPGSKIIFTRYYPSINTREFKLENGVRVFLKPTKYKDSSFEFSAKSFGGYSHANMDNLLSAKVSDSVITDSDLGNFSQIELSNKIRGGANVTISIGPYTENLSGRARTKKTKELFELIYLNFTSVKIKEHNVKNHKINLRENIKNENLDPKQVFYKKIHHVLYKKHPRRKSLTLDMVDQIKLDTVNEFYEDRFADSSDFVFTFVGDFSINKMKPYIEKYLGSLPSINRKESYVDHNVRLENKFKKIEISENSENKSINYRFYTNKFNNNIKNRTKLYIFEKILYRTIREEIREKQNLVYSISLDIFNISYFPTQQFTFYIYFESDPEKKDLIFKEIDKILKKFKNGEFEERYLDEAKLNRKNKLDEILQYNGFWANSITSYLFENQSITTFNRLHKETDKVSLNDIKKISKKTFNQNYIEASLLPKNPYEGKDK